MAGSQLFPLSFSECGEKREQHVNRLVSRHTPIGAQTQLESSDHIVGARTKHIWNSLQVVSGVRSFAFIGFVGY